MHEIVLCLICILFILVIKISDIKIYKIKFHLKWSMYIVYSAIVSVIFIFMAMWRGRDLRNTPLLMKLYKPMTKFHGITWHLENEEILKAHDTAVLISNHQSALDLIGIFHTSPVLKKWMGVTKKELSYMGPAGLTLYLIRTVVIDRKKPKEAYKLLNQAVEDMLKHKAKIWIFPEGKRNIELKTKLLPFKKGAFTVAIASQSPIIPIVFSPYYFIDHKKYIFENGGHIIMRCLEPIPTKGLTMDDVPELQERLHTIVLQAYQDLEKEVAIKYLCGHAITK